MRPIQCLLGLLLLLPLGCFASKLTIEPYDSRQFNPAQKEVFDLSVTSEIPGSIGVTFLSADGDKVRELPSQTLAESGSIQFSWDGRDSAGEVVPDEAYIPLIQLIDKGGTKIIFDPRESSGGAEITPMLNTTIDRAISFKLDVPARVLVRSGIKGGPMLKSLLNWKVRDAGVSRLTWDGFDSEGVVNLRERSDLALVATAFELPDHSVITHGNNATDYLSWRKKNKLPVSMPELSSAILAREGRRISRHYYLPRSIDVDPRVQLQLVGDLPMTDDGMPIVSGPVSLRVGMNRDDQWALQQSQFEVAFFADFQFLSEEEQGYIPLTWRWNPAGLAPGRHILTVNVSGFNGQVGVHSLEVELVSDNQQVSQ